MNVFPLLYPVSKDSKYHLIFSPDFKSDKNQDQPLFHHYFKENVQLLTQKTEIFEEFWDSKYSLHHMLQDQVDHL